MDLDGPKEKGYAIQENFHFAFQVCQKIVVKFVLIW